MEWKDIENLQAELREFVEERDWEQFHSPKNIAMALVVEAGELMEPFQWLTEEQSRELNSDAMEQVADEIADVQIYLARLADQLAVSIGGCGGAEVCKESGEVSGRGGTRECAKVYGV